MVSKIRLTKDIESMATEGHVYPAGSTGIFVEALGPNAALVELSIPNEGLVGGKEFETIELYSHEFEGID